MQFSSFLYRQKQRFKYHSAADLVERKIAEINRFEELIILDEECFKLKEVEDVALLRIPHSFVLDHFGLFVQLAKKSGGYFEVFEETLFFYIAGLKLKVQTAEEIFILNEIFFEQCYNFILPAKDLVVIDIGMNVGFASLYFSTKPEVKKIYSFEPFLPTFNNAQENFKNNPQYQKKIIAHNFGLSNSEKVVEVSYSKFNKGRNRTSEKSLNGDERVVIKLYEAYKQLIDIIQSTDYSNSIVIKMDCEGAEHEIFESLYQHDFPKEVIGIILEWHISKPAKIVQYLLKNSFKLINTSFGNETGLIYGFR